MQIRKYIYTLLILIYSLDSYGQGKDWRLSYHPAILYSSGNDLPFWLTSNQQGIYEKEANQYELIDLKVSRPLKIKKYPDKWDYMISARGIGAYTSTSFFRLNEWYTGARYKSFILKAGAFPEETVYNGLSSTNGDLRWSNNARPMPRVRLTTNEFISLPFGKRSSFWTDITFKVVYDEGLFDDHRYVKNTHLHHKLLYLKKPLNECTSLTFGADHYVMWGGTSPVYGKQSGFKSYLRYVLALPVSQKFTNSDQQYKAGNHLARYFIKLEQLKKNEKWTYYLDHPMENQFTMQNFADNLAGVIYQAKKKKLLSTALFEFMFTNDQNISRKKGLDDNGNVIQDHIENYFQHGLYRSGFSYDYRMITSPFFTPMLIKDGVNMGTANNRIIMGHLGTEGFLIPQLKWKTLLSYSLNKGTFDKSYNQIEPDFFSKWRKQFYSLFELSYLGKKGWNYSLSMAVDYGDLRQNQIGCSFSIAKTIRM